MYRFKDSVDRPVGYEHIPLFPKGFGALRVVQLVLTVAAIGLDGYAVSLFPTNGNSTLLAAAIVCLITSVYHLVSRHAEKRFYNYWAILSLDMLMVVLWACSFPLLASEVAGYFDKNRRFITTVRTFICNDSGCRYMEYPPVGGIYIVFPAVETAAASLGAINFALHIVSLSVHGVMLHRHRAAGLHSVPI
ncbi:hypothetical protein B0H63DRAFT_506117 [Podospora didyma]|uniref:MARVEL domain-containing protein n=1 Tax=Podospora didyma TaxID=330526 RepID=A0AAE0P6T9_9PEZI|nr:hypothetical protein B0H63DRAFT_506117 [Podospora didyma]